MIDVFVSASVPYANRHPRFYETADVLAIRESIKSLIEVVLPIGRLTCGGHPAITPLLALFVREAGLQSNRVTIFQSKLFAMEYPPELGDFLNVRTIAQVENNRERSLQTMRNEMLRSRAFSAGVFIGGMEGVIEEAEMFSELHPRAKMLPVSTTGAAAAEIYKSGDFSHDLSTELTYSTLFRRHLRPLIREG
ncbi:hypothetical protein [Agrobacterium sp. Azo12]|uniref:SLOG domain-containing protein n=1 Tax=Agrobacterium sp. Azo12 TaxID=3031129 RepID=UPI0023D7D289|nr:hypothetical protein [Agrobacterium sp. Azo12]MDO5895545.1 hypothetical protein [Agrobacterium sp. Azo12]